MFGHAKASSGLSNIRESSQQFGHLMMRCEAISSTSCYLGQSFRQGTMFVLVNKTASRQSEPVPSEAPLGAATDKLQPKGQNLGRIFNSRIGCVCARVAIKQNCLTYS